jgi:hypothetical protein
LPAIVEYRDETYVSLPFNPHLFAADQQW